MVKHQRVLVVTTKTKQKQIETKLGIHRWHHNGKKEWNNFRWRSRKVWSPWTRDLRLWASGRNDSAGRCSPAGHGCLTHLHRGLNVWLTVRPFNLKNIILFTCVTLVSNHKAVLWWNVGANMKLHVFSPGKIHGRTVHPFSITDGVLCISYLWSHQSVDWADSWKTHGQSTCFPLLSFSLLIWSVLTEALDAELDVRKLGKQWHSCRWDGWVRAALTSSWSGSPGTISPCFSHSAPGGTVWLRSARLFPEKKHSLDL